ncbi:hypothetical protein K503DRAFT_837755 [Rhizopogon vinicolor AM-OR11-026]|uniref:Uncharacterized protein n=1 Tax=Rhizopogon vinicolor AM-OR11-026 TaxID=1314800 RepID=A0A1B7MLV1_9AGAM|nr:hypothetical protein K503DRAFT_837755 [Rhizopogon vinicolor AM-OR11-026]
MAQILRERGFEEEAKLNAECPGFKCSPDKMSCCCRWHFLYNQPDFMNIKSHSHVPQRLETVCEECGFHVIFLPKFHCELSFIEMCWGFSKHVYQQFEPSSRGDVLEQNIIAALDSIPLETMHRFSIWSQCFIDAYRKGLNGEQAAWAIKKYCGHRVLPEHIMHNFDISLTQNTDERIG